MKILIVEDDLNIVQELKILLESNLYEVSYITDFRDTIDRIIAAPCDLVLLDINLPYSDGETILKELRKQTDLPVIMVTSSQKEIDELLSMSYGADDYITKPYNPSILLLRIEAVLKRLHREKELYYRDLKVNQSKGTLTKGNKELWLTKNEMIIFHLLLSHIHTTVTRDQLMTALWNNNEFINDNALSVNISRLRGKLADFGYMDTIITVKKQGYILE